MIYRTIIKRLESFYQANGSYALLIDGARQVGKTYIIEEFGRTHYESVVKIDFVKMKGAIGLFQDVEDEKEIISIFYGSGIDEQSAQNTALAIFEKACPDAEVSLLNGGQPVYYYLISAE